MKVAVRGGGRVSILEGRRWFDRYGQRREMDDGGMKVGLAGVLKRWDRGGRRRR